MGRLAKSTQQKALQGTLRPSRALRQDQITGEPVEPPTLSNEARKFWRTYVPRLVALGLAKDIDAPKLEQMATYWGLWCECQALLKGIDLGTVQASRIINNGCRCFDNFRRIAVQFGLSPLARNALTITEDSGETDDLFST